MNKKASNKYTVEIFPFIPQPENVAINKIVCVGENGFIKWVCLKCPCGCNELLTLSLMKSHYPNWQLEIDKLQRPTLSPSIINRSNCRSHFWIRKGKIEWFRKRRRWILSV